ncbi:MAG: non-canonical purine NTP pyrophosphatase [Treponema sp.]|nr:non-canonical purine NTP pyrophosphatase [Treponema sp.]
MTIWLASGNKHKQQELAAILGGCKLKLPAEAGIHNFDPEETGTTFAENALIKAGSLYHILNTTNQDKPYAVLADDSGLCVDVMGGRPGIYSARYYGKDSWAGNGAFISKPNADKLSDSERNILLLEEMAAQSTVNALRTCRFVCAMVLFFGHERFYLVQETMEGEIVSAVQEIRGHGGFGYDPVVYIPELNRTVAELPEEEKNLLSHRGKAGKVIAKLLC